MRTLPGDGFRVRWSNLAHFQFTACFAHLSDFAILLLAAGLFPSFNFVRSVWSVLLLNPLTSQHWAEYVCPRFFYILYVQLTLFLQLFVLQLSVFFQTHKIHSCGQSVCAPVLYFIFYMYTYTTMYTYTSYKPSSQQSVCAPVLLVIPS